MAMQGVWVILSATVYCVVITVIVCLEIPKDHKKAIAWPVYVAGAVPIFCFMFVGAVLDWLLDKLQIPKAKTMQIYISIADTLGLIFWVILPMAWVYVFLAITLPVYLTTYYLIYLPVRRFVIVVYNFGTYLYYIFRFLITNK